MSLSSLPACYKQCISKELSCSPDDAKCVCSKDPDGAALMISCLGLDGSAGCSPTVVVASSLTLSDICKSQSNGPGSSSPSPSPSQKDDLGLTLPTSTSTPGQTGGGQTGGQSGNQIGSNGSSSSKHSLPTAAIAGIGAGGGVLITALIAIAIVFFCRRRKRARASVQNSTTPMMESQQPYGQPQPSPQPSPFQPEYTSLLASPSTQYPNSPSPMTSPDYTVQHLHPDSRAGTPMGSSHYGIPPPADPATFTHELGSDSAAKYGALIARDGTPVFEMGGGDDGRGGKSLQELDSSIGIPATQTPIQQHTPQPVVPDTAPIEMGTERK